MRISCLLALSAAFVLAGCGSSSGEDPAVVDNERTIGNPAVYARIESLESCTARQHEFDIAADNTDRIQGEGGDAAIPMSYMNAAHNRLREVGCYG